MSDQIQKEEVKEKVVATTTTTNETNTQEGVEKVKVHFVAVGNAPILKRTKFQISAAQPFVAVTTFLRKMLKLTSKNGRDDGDDDDDDGGTNGNSIHRGSSTSLFLYVQSAFVPGPEELIGDVQKSFGKGRDELVIHYSLQEAWG